LTNAPASAPSHPRLRTALSWLLTLFWAGLIFQFSTETYSGSVTVWVLELLVNFLHIAVPPRTLEALHLLLRKIAHLCEYSIFAVLVYRSLEAQHPRSWRAKPALWACLVAGLYSLTDEYHQSFVPGREAALSDCGLDTVGAALGLLVVYVDARLLAAQARTDFGNNPNRGEVTKGVSND
jgi:VanZ family protein